MLSNLCTTLVHYCLLPKVCLCRGLASSLSSSHFLLPLAVDSRLESDLRLLLSFSSKQRGRVVSWLRCETKNCVLHNRTNYQAVTGILYTVQALVDVETYTSQPTVHRPRCSFYGGSTSKGASPMKTRGHSNKHPDLVR